VASLAVVREYGRKDPASTVCFRDHGETKGRNKPWGFIHVGLRGRGIMLGGRPETPKVRVKPAETLKVLG